MLLLCSPMRLATATLGWVSGVFCPRPSPSSPTIYTQHTHTAGAWMGFELPLSLFLFGL